MRLRVLLAVARSTLTEALRTPEAIFWTYGFPVIMAIGLGLAFSEERQDPAVVAVLPAPATAADLREALSFDPKLEVQELTPAEADRALVRGRVDAVVSGTLDTAVVRRDASRAESERAELIVQRAVMMSAADGNLPLPVARDERRPGSRYIDFLIPGLIGLNLLGAGMWGIGFTLVQMRAKSMLKRLAVTPMRRGEFLLGFLMGRLVLMLPESVFVALFGWLVFDVPFRGSILLGLLVVLLGGLAFAGIGLLVASRARTTETVSGLMNVVLIPMWLLGGSFFSSERFPDAMQPLVQALPLTHANHAFRELALGGAGLGEIWISLAALAATALVCFGAAVRMFRWS